MDIIAEMIEYAILFLMFITNLVICIEQANHCHDLSVSNEMDKLRKAEWLFRLEFVITLAVLVVLMSKIILTCING